MNARRTLDQPSCDAWPCTGRALHRAAQRDGLGPQAWGVGQAEVADAVGGHALEQGGGAGVERGRRSRFRVGRPAERHQDEGLAYDALCAGWTWECRAGTTVLTSPMVRSPYMQRPHLRAAGGWLVPLTNGSFPDSATGDVHPDSTPSGTRPGRPCWRWGELETVPRHRIAGLDHALTRGLYPAAYGPLVGTRRRTGPW